MDVNGFTLAQGPKLNLGCGPVQPDGWVNIDGSNRAFLASRLNWLDRSLVRLRILPPTNFTKRTKHHNLLYGIPFGDQSVACIYAGELWEHFEYPDALKLTQDCFRVLNSNGVLRVCVPDGPTFWKEYLRLHEDELAKSRTSRNPQPLIDHVQMYFNEICTRRVYLGSMGHTHKWNFDEIQLVDMFERSGFSDVERMGFNESRIPDVDQVERSDFLIVEGIKK